MNGVRLGMMAALALLVGCGELGQRPVAARVVELLRPGSGAAATPIETPGFTGEALARNPQNFMVFSIPTLGRNEPARIIADNGAEQTWAAQSGWTAAFDDGILVATRGLSFDLLATDGSQTRAAIRAGGGTAVRLLETVDSQDRITTITLDCTVTQDGSETVNLGLREVGARKFTETCRSPVVIFENAYWVDGSGAIVSSRQFVSITVAYLLSNHL